MTCLPKNGDRTTTFLKRIELIGINKTSKDSSEMEHRYGTTEDNGFFGNMEMANPVVRREEKCGSFAQG